jgi:hypothetical protein
MATRHADGLGSTEEADAVRESGPASKYGD